MQHARTRLSRLGRGELMRQKQRLGWKIGGWQRWCRGWGRSKVDWRPKFPNFLYNYINDYSLAGLKLPHSGQMCQTAQSRSPTAISMLSRAEKVTSWIFKFLTLSQLSRLLSHLLRVFGILKLPHVLAWEVWHCTWMRWSWASMAREIWSRGLVEVGVELRWSDSSISDSFLNLCQII